MSSIIDNRDDNSLLNGLRAMSSAGRVIKIATAFFSLDALLLLSDTLKEYEKIQILFGDDASAVQRRKLLQMLRTTSDEDLLAQRENLPNLSPLRAVEKLFIDGKIEARCYTARKFHAKAYLIDRPGNYPPKLGIIGSGNFTRPGLTQNIELNVSLYEEQTAQLESWFDDRWNEAAADIVTDDVLAEIRRQIDLYSPHVIYVKALYTWGDQQQVTGGLSHTLLHDKLDPHQEQGYRRALKVLEREHGVMVCDGVGLGKSFIALALIEHYCTKGDNVLLIAPKSIINSSWDGYIETYLSEFRQPFGSIFRLPMTELGFDSEADGPISDSIRNKRDLVRRLHERADVIVIDESHNFRSSSADRYKNLNAIAQISRTDRKKVILLTATPINTTYRDISNQLALITQENGSIGGFRLDQIKRACADLDRSADRDGEAPVPEQLNLDILDTPSETLNKILHASVVQRSRATCKELARVTGKELRFPTRRDPEVVEATIGEASPLYRELIARAWHRFEPTAEYFKKMQEAVIKSNETGKPVLPVELKKVPTQGIKLAAFLTEQYRIAGAPEGANRRRYEDEVHLAKLVFTNTMKQMESSPVAFQGILQSLGTGLIARLKHVLGDEADRLVREHEEWLRTPLFEREESQELPDVDTDDDVEEDGDSLDASGDESDAWITQAVKSRQLDKKLRGFNEQFFDIERWRSDIISDLRFLREIHQATLLAREQPDPKMEKMVPRIASMLGQGTRIILFTQSLRTASYLEKELIKRLPTANIARIDSRVEKTRPAILHAFCPGYNKYATAPSVPASIDILISTDVLSEGVNLQEAGAIISWDVHWNPVRLIQRIGRVDRRLDPEITPIGHSFDIINVVPPPEIDDIINLVGTIENRTLRISRALGIDVSFFSTNDPSGNLIEFNSQYEGSVPAVEHALGAYARLATEPPDAKTKALIDATPPGAFGVWHDAPRNGLFALFTIQPKPSASDADKERFAALIGHPVLILEGEAEGQRPSTDAGDILTLMAGTTLGQRSGVPSDEEELKHRLAKLKNHVRSQFADISLPASFMPKLVCWMELRKAQS